MIIYKNPISIVTRNDIPNGNWTGETDVFIVDDHSELGQKIMQYAPFFELVFDDEDNLVDAVQKERPPEPEPQPSEIELLKEQVRTQQEMIDDLVFNIIPDLERDPLLGIIPI